MIGSDQTRANDLGTYISPRPLFDRLRVVLRDILVLL